MSESEEEVMNLLEGSVMKENNESDEEESEKNNTDEGTSTDDDDELQVAFKEGLLQKHGLVVPQLKKRASIYKKDEMERKFVHFHKKRNWLDTLHVSFGPNLRYTTSVDNDFEREAAFYQQALSSVKMALPRLESLKVPIHRPGDYFAEMAKSDKQMDRVRRKLLDTQKTNDRREQAKRLREERKFAVKVQRSREDRKRKDKRKLIEATKKHKKGMKGQLEEMLKNAKRMHTADDEDEDNQKFGGKSGRKGKGGKRFGGGKMSRTSRDKRFGFGGQKKRSKGNDKKSFEMH